MYDPEYMPVEVEPEEEAASESQCCTIFSAGSWNPEDWQRFKATYERIGFIRGGLANAFWHWCDVDRKPIKYWKVKEVRRRSKGN